MPMTMTVDKNKQQLGNNYVLAMSKNPSTLDGLTVMNGGAGVPISGHYFQTSESPTDGFAAVVVPADQYNALLRHLQLPNPRITIGLNGGGEVTSFSLS
jgi:hypothetical protein